MPIKRRSLLVYGVPLALLLAGASVMIFANRLQNETERLAETGKGAIQMLSQYRAAVHGHAADEIAARYGEQYSS